ncbi:MAG TPA: hypothetical protein VE690_17675, partial [Rhodopila sp.]|nr:hypothetical protein [Rhodopila sp.]
VRFKPAADWLAQRQKNATVASTTGPDRAQFEAFLAKHGGTRLTAAERDATWQYFQEQLHNQAHTKQ